MKNTYSIIYTFLLSAFYFLHNGNVLHAQATVVADDKLATDSRQSPMTAFRKFPINISLVQEFSSNSDYEIERDGQIMEKGNMDDAMLTSLQLSLPVLKSRTGFLSLGGFYKFKHLDFLPKNNFGERYVYMGDEHQIWGFSSSYMLVSEFFGRPFTGMANLRGEFSGTAIERITGMAMGLWQLKKSERSSLNAGFVFLINTSSPWPLFPIITYRCKFDERWSLDIMLPQMYCNYKISSDDKLSAGCSIGGEHFYVTPERDDLPETCMYGRSNIRPEILYEHNFNPLLKFQVRGGYSICINSRLYSRSGNTRYVDISQDASFFMQFGISYGLNMFR